MSAEENKAVVRRYYEELWNTGDSALVEECFAPDVRIQGHPVGWDGLRDGLAGWLTAFPDIRHRVDHLVAEGDLVAAHVHFAGTHRGVFHEGDLGTWPPTGRSVDVQEMNFFRLAAGKVVEMWVVWDQVGFAQQLGVSLPPAPGE
jgi:predicted ester cyclase